MAIIENVINHTITLTTKHSSYQMKIDDKNVLLHTYYGSNCGEDDMSYRIDFKDRGFSGNPYESGFDRTYSLDVLPQEYSAFGAGDYRQTAFSAVYEDGSSTTEFRYVSHTVKAGKYNINGLPALFINEADGFADSKATCHTLIITLKDIVKDLYVDLYYGVFEENDCITRAVVVRNETGQRVKLNKVMSFNLDTINGEYDCIHFPGRYAVERSVKRAAVETGIFKMESLRGTSSHQENPFFILADKKANEEYGECYGFSLLYSGGFLSEIQKEHVDQTRILMGIQPETFSWNLEAQESFYSPEAAMFYSAKGFTRLSQNIHKTFKKHLIRNHIADEWKPVLINSWESVYFSYNIDKLVEIARSAKETDIDMFVLDDGWFGKRENDLSGLGDWFVNEEKLGGSLKQLSEQIHNLDMRFGLWFEPECVSEDSQLYKQHPEWAIQVPGRNPQRSRYQLVLNMARTEVQDYLFDRVASLIEEAEIDYIKWDFNRSPSDWFGNQLPADAQLEMPHRYILGLYSLMERLVTRFPKVLFEGCSGGGGRFDAGMLYYMPQIWCSDNTDAINRLTIQQGTSFGYPISTVGSHVSAVPNHQTKRVTPFSTRAMVAMAGTFGYELNVALLTDEEKEQIRRQVAFYKAHFDLFTKADYYRLTQGSKEEVFQAWEMSDSENAIITAVHTRLEANALSNYLSVKGLNPDKVYKVYMVDFTQSEIMKQQLELTGRALMAGGLLLPEPNTEYQSYMYFLKVKE